MKRNHLILSLMAGATILALAGCEKKSPAEEAVDDIGDAVEEAADEIGDAVREAD